MEKVPVAHRRGGKNFVKLCRKVLQKGKFSDMMSVGNTGTTSGDRKVVAHNAVLCGVRDHSTQRTKARAVRLIMPLFPSPYNRGGVIIGFCGNALKFFRAALSYALNAALCVSDSGVRGTGNPVPHGTPCQDRIPEYERRHRQTKIEPTGIQWKGTGRYETD